MTENQAMSCPVCRVPLVMSERQGVEIDYCPQCRGVWLDRGELDKVIERSTREFSQAQQPAPQQHAPQAQQPRHREHREHREHHGDYDRHRGDYPQDRRRSFLEDLFD